MTNLFMIENNKMSPYAMRGDLVQYELIKDCRVICSLYVVELYGVKMLARITPLIRGGVALSFDDTFTDNIELSKEQISNIVFIGHVIGLYKKSGEHIERFSLYN